MSTDQWDDGQQRQSTCSPPGTVPLVQPVDEPNPVEWAGFLPGPGLFFILLALYFTLHLILRTAISETVGIDEGDQIVVGQKLSWGYGPYPPLYTWIGWAFLHVFGYSVFALTLFRELMLFGIYWLTYRIARTLSGSHACAVVAVVGLQFHPTIFWESQRELTHSILASLMVLAMVFAFFRIKPGRLADYLLFGFLGGLATLSKYNGALVELVILLAAISLPAYRPRVLSRHMLAACALSLLILLPNLHWVAAHKQLAFAAMYKFGIHETTSWVQACWVGLANSLSAIVQHIGVVILVFGVVFGLPLLRTKTFPASSPEAKLLGRSFLFTFGLVAAGVVLFKATDFKDRWFQPAFITLPIWLALSIRPWLTLSRLKALLLGGLLVSIVTLVASPGRMFLTEPMGKRNVLNAPFRQLAPQLAPLISGSDFVVSNDRWLAANVHLWFPDELAISPNLMDFFGPTGRKCLLIWEIHQDPQMPPELKQFAEEFSGAQPQQLGIISEPWKYFRHGKCLQLGYCELTRRTPSAHQD